MTISLAMLAMVAAAAGEPIKIGEYGPLTGGSAPMGISMRDGAQLAVDEVNAAGGVLGRPLALVAVDDEAKPDRGAQAVKDLVEKERVVALVGPGNTGVANASTQLANERHVPHVVSAATGNPVNELFAKSPDNYVFRLAASDAIQSEMLVTEAFVARGLKKVALLCDDSPYGTQGRARVEALVAKRGSVLAYVGTFKVGDVDMTAQLAAARAAGAEGLLLYALGAEDAMIARSLEKLGWRVPMIGTWQLCNPANLTKAGPYGEGATMPQTFIEAGASEPKQLAFVAAFRKRFGVEHVSMAPSAAQSYDAVHLLALAMRQAGTTDGPKVKAAMEALEGTYDGATGSYDAPWRPDDHEAVTQGNVIWGMVKNGAVVPDDPAARAK